MSSLHYHLLHVGRSVGTMDLHDIHTPHRTFELHAVQQNPEEETCLSTHFLLSPHGRYTSDTPTSLIICKKHSPNARKSCISEHARKRVQTTDSHTHGIDFLTNWQIHRLIPPR